MNHEPAGLSAITVDNVAAGYSNDSLVLNGASVDIPRGAVTAIIGPNGCGKSTLLKTFTGLLKPREGSVLIEGRDITSMSRKELAQKVSCLPQKPVAPAGVVVSDLVAMGRFPHSNWVKQWSHADDGVVSEALAATGMLPFAHRRLDELSGGQQQRVWVSLILAQATDIMLLDEPTTYLDLAHSLELLDLVDELSETKSTTVCMVLHDLALAARYADYLVVVRDGAVCAAGDPNDIVSEDLLYDVFGLRAKVGDDPVSNRPLIVPCGRRRTRLS